MLTSLQTIVQGFCKLDYIRMLPASRILDSGNVSNVTIVLHLSAFISLL